MTNKSARYFIGLDLSAKDKLTLENWRHSRLGFLCDNTTSDKPVPVKNFHITLSFLGHVTDDKVEQLIELLDAIRFNSFQLQTSQFGVFVKPQILYLGTHLTCELNGLAQQCLAINSKLNFKQDHSEYRPHVTLFRKHKEAIALDVKPPQLDLNFSEFHLFESVSRKGKSPCYPIRMTFPALG